MQTHQKPNVQHIQQIDATTSRKALVELTREVLTAFTNTLKGDGNYITHDLFIRKTGTGEEAKTETYLWFWFHVNSGRDAKKLARVDARFKRLPPLADYTGPYMANYED